MGVFPMVDQWESCNCQGKPIPAGSWTTAQATLTSQPQDLPSGRRTASLGPNSQSLSPRLQLYYEARIQGFKQTQLPSLHLEIHQQFEQGRGALVCSCFYVTLCPRRTLRLILIWEGTEHAETEALTVVDSSRILQWSVTSVNYSLQKGHPKHSVVMVASSTKTDQGIILVIVSTRRSRGGTQPSAVRLRRRRTPTLA